MSRESSFQHRPESLDELLDEVPRASAVRSKYSGTRGSTSRLAAAAFALGCVGEGCATTAPRTEFTTETYASEARADQERANHQESARTERQNDAIALRLAWENTPPQVMAGLSDVANTLRREQPASPVADILTRLPQIVELAEVFHEEWQVGRGDTFPLRTLENISNFNRRLEEMRQDPQAAMDIAKAIYASLNSQRISVEAARLFLHRFIHPNLEVYRLHAQRERGAVPSIVRRDNRFVLRLLNILSNSEVRLLQRFVDTNLSLSEGGLVDIDADHTTFVEFSTLRRIQQSMIGNEGTFSRQTWEQILQNGLHRAPTSEETHNFFRSVTLIETKMVVLGMIFCGVNAPGLSSTETQRIRYPLFDQEVLSGSDNQHQESGGNPRETMRAAENYDRPSGYTIPTTRDYTRSGDIPTTGNSRPGSGSLDATIRASQQYDRPGHAVHTTRDPHRRNRGLENTLRASEAYDQSQRETSE
ncbi:hypothetical protein KBB27_00050 [Patescibacteria group bacterium]|nr:hypothetical protein [Patescibacteria group bacterium]